MTRLRPSRRDERGQILVIVAGGVTALILLMGLVLDGGLAFFNRRDGQNTSDVMALAGTKFVADVHRGEAQADPSITSTHTALDRAAAANGCTAGAGTPCTWQAWFVGPGLTITSGPADLSPVTPGAAVPPTALGVRVAVNRQPRTFVVAFIGRGNWVIDTQATAIAERLAIGPANRLLPIAFKGDPTTAYQPGQVYDLTDGKDLPGGFGYISWTGSNSAGDLETSLCAPNNPEFTLPTTFVGDPGKTNSDGVRACLSQWIATGQTVLIPIYDTTTGNGNGAVYSIIGVAAFVLTASEQPAVDNIRGYFVEIFTDNPVPGGVGSQPPTVTDTSFSLGLVR